MEGGETGAHYMEEEGNSSLTGKKKSQGMRRRRGQLTARHQVLRMEVLVEPKGRSARHSGACVACLFTVEIPPDLTYLEF